MTKIVTCEYCKQKINAHAIEEQVLWACPACGAPLPDFVELYDPVAHGQWWFQYQYQPATDQLRYDTGYNTGTDGSYMNVSSHYVASSVMTNALQGDRGLTLGYSPGLQPDKGDMYIDPEGHSFFVFDGKTWMQVENQF